MSLNVKDPEAHRLAQAIAQATGETMTRVHNISINGGRHRPRNSRSHLRMLFLPDPISGLPIPRYFENVLWLRTGRTRIPFPSLSNNRRSPARTPKMRRSSRDTVIFHLLVIRACFCISNPVPYFGTFSLRETGDPAPAPGAANPDYPITIGSGIRLAVAVHSGCTNWPVQPGCTNASLSALFPSKTNADIGGYIGGSLARAKAEYTTSMAGVCAPTHTRRTNDECQ